MLFYVTSIEIKLLVMETPQILLWPSILELCRRDFGLGRSSKFSAINIQPLKLLLKVDTFHPWWQYLTYMSKIIHFNQSLVETRINSRNKAQLILKVLILMIQRLQLKVIKIKASRVYQVRVHCSVQLFTQRLQKQISWLFLYL